MKTSFRLFLSICMRNTRVVISFLFLTAFIFLPAITVQAQNQIKEKPDYTKEPAWIKMISNPSVNYYEALKAYDEYWKHHVKPAGEEEEMGEEGKDNNERERELKREIRKDRKIQLTSEELKKKNESEMMKLEVKRFEQWAREMKPFVQEDGRILSDRERMEIWKKQQEDIRKQK